MGLRTDTFYDSEEDSKYEREYVVHLRCRSRSRKRAKFPDLCELRGAARRGGRLSLASK